MSKIQLESLCTLAVMNYDKALQNSTISWSLSHINMRTYGCLQKDKGSYLNILQAKMDIAEKEDTANQHKPT